MAFFRIILLLLFFTPALIFLSGCYDDAFLDAMKEEADFIAPFDVVLSDDEDKRTTYFELADTESDTHVEQGDDASYVNIPRDMDLQEQNNVNGNGDDIVYDRVTELTWTKCSATGPNYMDTDDNCTSSLTDDYSDSTLMEWSTAVSTCKNLTYAGYSDWRLPRLPEMLTIVNYNKYPLAIDPAYFPNTQQAFDSPSYTNSHYSPDIRTHYSRTGSPGNYIYSEDVNGTFVEINGVFTYEDNDEYMPDEDGEYILVYIPYNLFDGTGNATIAGELVHVDGKDRYNASFWGVFLWYTQNDSGDYARVYIKDKEDRFIFDGRYYASDSSGKYIRSYIPVNSPVSGNYEFDPGTGKYVIDTIIDSGKKYFEQATYKPDVGYWTYTSKLTIGDNYNTSEYAWVVFFQGGGMFGVNLANLKLKLKTDLTLERQYVKCVRGGKGDSDDID